MIPVRAEVGKNSNPAADEPPDLFHVEQIDCGLRIAEFATEFMEVTENGESVRFPPLILTFSVSSVVNYIAETPAF